MTWRLGAVALLAGCFQQPALHRDGGADGTGSGDAAIDAGSCAAPPGGLTLTEEAVTHRITARFSSGAALVFADEATRYPFPVQIVMGAEQLAPEAPMSDCNGEESAAGVAVYPIYAVSGLRVPPLTTTHVLERVVVGAAYTQLVTSWSYTHPTACTNGSAITGTGETTWALYPDGRVVRSDEIQPAANASFSVPDDTCSCTTSSSFVVASYLALAEPMVSRIVYPNAPEAGVAPPPDNLTVTDEVGACIVTPGGARLGMQWDRTNLGQRHTRVRNYADVIGLASDLIPLVGPGSTSTLGAGNSIKVRTQILLEPSPTALCTTVNDTLEAHAGAPSITIGGAPTPANALGVYDDVIGGHEHTTQVEVTATTRVERGWAAHVRFPGFRSITTSVPSLWQHELDDSFYVFFPDGLSAGASVTIAPGCLN